MTAESQELSAHAIEPESADKARWDFLSSKTPPGLFLSSDEDDLYLVVANYPDKKFAIVLRSFMSTQFAIFELDETPIAFGYFTSSFTIVLEESEGRPHMPGMLTISNGCVWMLCYRDDNSRRLHSVGITPRSLENFEGDFPLWSIDSEWGTDVVDCCLHFFPDHLEEMEDPEDTEVFIHVGLQAPFQFAIETTG